MSHPSLVAIRLTLVCLCFLTVAASASAAMPQATVQVEEDVYTLVPPDNGSGPMWSYGCTTILRLKDDVIVSQMETGKGVPKLCNTRWRILRRDGGKWSLVAEADGYRQREPAVLATLDREDFLLNVNDSIMPPGTMYGPTKPHLLRFTLADAAHPQRLEPVWAGQTHFTDHSYRGFGVDAGRGDILMMNIDAEISVQNWCLMDAGGGTLANGGISFPIRSCYPQVAVSNGAGYVVAISDIKEPVKEWGEYKHAQTGRDWDYVFRILYFSSSADLRKGGFQAPIEVANVDATGGHIGNQDLWVGPDGEAYVMYIERDVQSEMMRDKFFPGISVKGTLKLAVIRDGAVAERRTLLAYSDTEEPGWARFHQAADGSLFAVAAVSGATPRNVLMRIHPYAEGEAPVEIPLTKPFSSFLLANVRAGCAPSDTIDIFGHTTSGTVLSYAQVDLATAQP